MGAVEQRVREFYDTAGPAYSALMGHFWHHGEPASEARGLTPEESAKALARKQVEAAGLRPGGFALDFGSGVGGTTTFMAESSGAHIVGLSNNEGLSQEARAYARGRGMAERATFITVGDEDYRHLSAWPDDSLDMVSFFESVVHLPQKDAFFRAAFRILKPGARLVGVDWVQRAYGEHQTAEQIARWMAPVERHIAIPHHGTVDSYRTMMRDAGFTVETAEDLYAGIACWGSTPPEDRQAWLTYDGAEGERFQDGKRALDAARGAGVFSVGRWVAVKPG